MILLALIGLGGVVALDATSFGQLMLSRPLVAGTLAGALVGMPLEGALLGAMLETLSLSILPVGAARYPEVGTATVAAVGTLGLSQAAATPSALMLALMYGVIWQHAAGISVRAGRYFNERILHLEDPPKQHMDRIVEHRHVSTLLLDIARGIAVTTVALLIGMPLLRLVVPLWSLPSAVATGAIAVSAAAVIAGAAPFFCDSWTRRILLLGGVIAGCLLLIAR
jgi:mannose/fructose/N-acetylgalactosamine-specific phosphotransferase system component IIC